MISTAAKVVDRKEWLEARLVHLDQEKAFTRQRDELSRQRRALPWVDIDSNYEFEGPEGRCSLRDLFGDNSQLLVYHFMFGPGWVEGCPSCSFWADNYEGIGVHLAARDTSLVAISRAPLAELEEYRSRMEWTFPWYSSADSSFNFDMGVSFAPEKISDGSAKYNFGTQPAHGEEMPGISIFARDGDKIFLTYQTFSRGLDMLNGAYHMLDLTPSGRGEDQLDFSMGWLRRHDSY